MFGKAERLAVESIRLLSGPVFVLFLLPNQVRITTKSSAAFVKEHYSDIRLHGQKKGLAVIG